MSYPGPEDDAPLVVEIANRQSTVTVVSQQCVEAVRLVLSDAGYTNGEISVAIVDDPTIHQLNQRYLQHDYPTDVLAFILEEFDAHLEGEIVISAEAARRNAIVYHQTPEHEILLYVIHGALHLVGYQDHSAEEIKTMRMAEQRYMQMMQSRESANP